MRTIALIVILFFARIASAQVLISEIMYDPKGTDASAGGEWIEIQNSSSATIDLTKWFFFENKIQHIIATDSAPEVPPGGYAVISSDDDAFKKYFTNFSGLLFKASFSLNSSEDIAMKSSNKPTDPVIDSVLYSSEQGAKNDGNSLQKIDGVWNATTPTPGTGSSPTQTVPDAPLGTQEAQGASSNNEAVSTTVANNTSSFPVEPQIFTKITAQTQTVSVGAVTTFTGRVWGLKKEPIENARMVWAFGDGARAEGSAVTHTFYYPGEYTVVIDASSGYYAASDRVRIVAVMPMIVVRTGSDGARTFVAVENRGANELDLSEWQVMAQGKTFIIPKNTLVSAHKTLTLASEVTGLITPAESTASLHFPNGTQVSVQGEVAPAISSSTKEIIYTKPAVHAIETKTLPQENQEASVIGAKQGLLPENPKTDLWVWYVGVAFFAATALLGLRFTRKASTPGLLTADDFEITDEDEDKKDDLF